MSMTETTNRVEELQNFPFETFVQTRKAIAENRVFLQVDADCAMYWVNHGKNVSSSAKFSLRFYWLAPFIVMLMIAIEAAIADQWLMIIFTFPLVYISKNILRPSCSIISESQKTIVIDSFGVIAFVLLLLDLIFAAALAALPLVVWLSYRASYKIAKAELVMAAADNEELFCSLWRTNKMSVGLIGGEVYLADDATRRGLDQDIRS